MKKLTAFILCFLLLLSPMLASAAEYEEETVYATENVNIRTKPTTESEKVALLKKVSTLVAGELSGKESDTLRRIIKNYAKAPSPLRA